MARLQQSFDSSCVFRFRVVLVGNLFMTALISVVVIVIPSEVNRQGSEVGS